MTRIETLVVQTATFNAARQRWLFEGKDTLEWLALAEGMRQTPGQHNEADEGYIISGRLQGLDNNEDTF